MATNRSFFNSIDIPILISVVTLITVGILFIFSSGISSRGFNISNEYIKQLIWGGLGLIMMLVVAQVRYDIYRDLSLIFYVVFLVLVAMTLITGRVVNGAKSWLGIGDLGIQPSEFLKIATILLLAASLDRWGSKIKEVRYLMLAGLIVLVPMVLIFVQPDLGTALVFIPIFLFMTFMAGASTRHLLFIVGIAFLSILFTMLPAWDQYLNSAHLVVLDIFFNKTLVLIVCASLASIVLLCFIGFFWFKQKYFQTMGFLFSIPLASFIFSFAVRLILKEYQMKRLLVFLDPYFDAKGSGWNIIQSVTAVGSGGIVGKGFLQGTQSHLRFLPEQSTDFIFSIISEEWGFVGGILIFLCFAVIFYRGLNICRTAKDNFGSYIAAGVVGMLFFHLLVNVGMAIGVMPITGIPLFFLSYGGSSLWVGLCALGILMSIKAYRYQF